MIGSAGYNSDLKEASKVSGEREELKGPLLYEGKAKRVYRTADPAKVIIEYKDDATAFNAQKRGFIQEKGILNNAISARFFEMLERAGIATHFVERLNERETLAWAVQIVPLEVVVRNVAAGSLTARLGLEEGYRLPKAVVEFYLKDDRLGDPIVNRDHILLLGLATEEELDEMKRLALEINRHLTEFLQPVGLDLIDFKLEFGRREGKILLADEISPDTCRFWDVQTGERLDKDRFRRDLGNVAEAYKEVFARIERRWGS